MPLPVALSLHDVTVRYARRTAVDRLTLDVRRGEIVGLIGPNGSGKSSTLAVAAGLLDPAFGSVTIDGIDHTADPFAYAAKVGLVPQDPALYDELTAGQNLAFFAKLYGLAGIDRDARVGRALTRAGLTDRAGDRVGTFSGGMKQRLSVAVALLHDPPVLLLDEPTAALDPASRDSLFADLHRLREDGHAVLLTTHHLDEAEFGCDRVAVLDAGRLTAVGRPCDVLRGGPGGRAVLYGHLRTPLPGFVRRGLKEKLAPAADLEITGRRVRLAAGTGPALGRALAAVLAEGAELDTFRTPPGRTA